MKKFHFQVISYSAVVLFFLSSCLIFHRNSQPTVPSPILPSTITEIPTIMVEPTIIETTSDEELILDPRIERLLALNSITMTLITKYPEADPEETLIFVDDSGNQMIESHTPDTDDTSQTPPPVDWNLEEIYIVNGEAYTRLGGMNTMESTPQELDAVRDLLYSPNAPGLWLLMTPEEDFLLVANEDFHGFNADHYRIESMIDVHQILGDIWLDTDSGALIGAELKIAGEMFRMESNEVNEDLIISFLVDKKNIPQITLPE